MTDSNAGVPWEMLASTSSTQRDILEQTLLHYPKRLARWIAQHYPERLLPNKESAGVLDALDGWGEEPRMQSDYFSSGWISIQSPITYTQYKSALKSITKAHGNNNNGSSK